MSDEIIIDVELKGIAEAASQSKELAGSLDDLTESSKKLKEQRDKLDLTTEKGRKEAAKLEDQIIKNTKAAKDNSTAVKDQTSKMKELGDSVVNSVPGLSNMTSIISSMVNPIALVGAGIGALTALLSKNQLVQDQWTKAMAASDAILQKLADDLVDVSVGLIDTSDGQKKWYDALIDTNPLVIAMRYNIEALDFVTGGYITRLKEAGEEAANAAIKMKELQIETVRAAGFQKLFESAAENARRVRDNAELTLQERLKATKTVEDNLKASRDVRLNVLYQEIEAIKDSNENWRNQRELVLEIENKRREVFDIEEEINGKLTENVMSRRAIVAEIEKESQARLASLELLRQAREGLNEQEVVDAETLAEALLEIETDKVLNKDIINQTYHEAEISRREKETAAAKNEADKQKKIEDLKNQSIMGGIDILLKKKTGARTLLTTLFKADAMKETAMNGYDAAVAAYKSLAGIPIVGPVLGAAAATAVGVFTAFQLSRMAGIQFAKGGKVGTTGGKLHSQGGTKYFGEDGNVVELERGENWYVLNRGASREISSLSNLNKKYSGVGFNDRPAVRYAAAGGMINTVQSTISPRDVESIVRTTLQSVRIVTYVDDIRTGISNQVEVEEKSRVL